MACECGRRLAAHGWPAVRRPFLPGQAAGTPTPRSQIDVSTARDVTAPPCTDGPRSIISAVPRLYRHCRGESDARGGHLGPNGPVGANLRERVHARFTTRVCNAEALSSTSSTAYYMHTEGTMRMSASVERGWYSPLALRARRGHARSGLRPVRHWDADLIACKLYGEVLALHGAETAEQAGR